MPLSMIFVPHLLILLCAKMFFVHARRAILQFTISLTLLNHAGFSAVRGTSFGHLWLDI